ncbi:MAG: ABC transporter ATP-binding protein [Nitrospirota bacterium]
MPENIIEARGLYKEYSGYPAVKGIDFTVERAECFGFLGPNGAGKTTTMNMLQGYATITGGTLKVFGMDLRGNERKIKSRLGVVPQENNLDPDLSVMENLRVYARYFDIPRTEAMKRAASLLEMMSLLDKKDEKITRLSGGMKRRLMLARALINESDLIMLDEPTTGLDPQARHLIWQKLKEQKRQGRTMVLTTHYMDEAAHLCDRLVVMDQGKILALGTPQELIDKYAKGSVVELQIPDGGAEEILSSISGADYNYEISGDTLFINSDDGDLILARLSSFIKSGFVHRPATLEDVFLKLTGRELRE